MKSKKLLKASLALSLVFGSIVPTVVSASDFDTNDTNNISTKSQNEEISQDVVEKADHLVEVQNNQFVLSKDAENKFDDSEIYSIKKLISESNTQVRHDHSQIDTSDKSFEVNSGDANPFVSFASTRKEYTYKHFWWGTRFYFRSNAAVNQMVRELRSSAKTMSAFGLGAGEAAVVAGNSWHAFRICGIYL